MAAKKQVVVQEAGPAEVVVMSKFDRFVDLVSNVEITKEPKSVVMHAWLQAQIDAGHLIVVE